MPLRRSQQGNVLTSPAAQATFTTNFPATENPISQGSIWLNGEADGGQWLNVRTTPGLAFATDFIGGNTEFNDCLAILKSASVPITANQSAQGVVFRAGGYSPTGDHECELLLRFSITSNSATGYEILRNTKGEGNIVRWNGPLANFTAAFGSNRSWGIPADGDVVYAEIIGNTLLVKINGVTQDTIDVSTAFGGGTVFSTGQPGIGFWPRNSGGVVLASYGWKSFAANNL